MSSLLSITEFKHRDTVELRARLVRLLSSMPAERLQAELDTWNTPAPIRAFEVLDGLIIPAPPAVRVAGTGLDLGTGAHVEMNARDTDSWAVFTLRDNADSPGIGVPFRATLARRKADGWVLLRIDAMCVSCFGSGVVEAQMRPCDTCGSLGWGNAEVTAIPVSSPV